MKKLIIVPAAMFGAAAWFMLIFAAFSGCSTAKKKDQPIALLSAASPIILQRDGIGKLVTVEPGGRWVWHRKPAEVVSELVRALGQFSQAIADERAKVVKGAEDLKACKAPPKRDAKGRFAK